MRFQQFQVSGDPCRVFAAPFGVGVRLRIQALAQVLVTNPLDMELAAQQHPEYATIFQAYGTQRPEPSSLAGDWFTYFVQQLMRRSWFTYHRERLQIELISGARNRHASADIGNAFTQGQPFHDYHACFICHPTAHLKALRVIDSGFSAQHAASFVIHRMYVVGGLIVGNPSDTRESVEANLEFARRYVDWPYIRHPTPYPRTPS